MIKAEVENLGFSLFGVTTPDPPQHLDIFDDWLARGYHAGMSYLGREDLNRKRSDPRLLLPGCKSVIMLGLPYSSAKLLPTAGEQYRIASYALLEDYHEWIPERLQKISELISDFSPPGRKCLVCTDSAPILERDLAWRAGLGWIGRNGCLISPKSGSFFLIAEILTELELPLDEPIENDFCGNCSKCQDACPTGCIKSNRTLDARECIAYLTIENKDEIPVNLRSLMGDHLFGCDICQDVCPWNKKQASDNYVLPVAKYEQGPRNLKEILSLENTEFEAIFQHSSILRSKRSGLLRNAAIVMGNQSLPENLPFLQSRMRAEKDGLILSHLEWAASKFENQNPM